MTEWDWLRSKDLLAMLGYAERCRASARRFRLFACACCRGLEHLFRGTHWTARVIAHRCLAALRTSEGYADGVQDSADLAIARQPLWEVSTASPPLTAALWAARWAAKEDSDSGVATSNAAAPAELAREAARWAAK